MLFRRTKSEPETVAAAPKPGGKGRPTPSRKEAEAAAKARAKTPRTRKEQAAAERLKRSESSRKMRDAMKGGDERYLPARDKGPMRRFVRDYVDVRFSLVELLIPLLLVTMVLSYSGNAKLAGLGSTILMAALLLVVIDMVVLRFRLRRELARRFPGESIKGTTYYAIGRSMQMKFMRLPKSRVKFGQQLPDDYR